MQAQKAEGTRDLIGAEMRAWQKMQQIAAGVFEPVGFKPIETPAIEQVDVFVHGIGQSTDVVRKEMFRVFSGANLERVFTEGTDTKLKPKQRLALRPEGTAGVVRAVVENNLVPQGSSPVKAYYAEAMFRGERPQKGRLRQFHQVGIEWLGAPDPAADAECIIMLMEFYKRLGFDLSKLRLLINSMGDAQCRPAYREQVKQFILDHADEMCDECREHFEKVKSYLDALMISYVVNPHIVRGLDYYTKTVFEFVSHNEKTDGLVCGGGGRYDGLIEELGGQHTPSLGFAMGLERLLSVIEAQGIELPGDQRCDIYIGSIGDAASLVAAKLCTDLRSDGVSAQFDVAGRSVKAQMKYADKLGARFTCVIGDDDIAKGEVTVKNMENGEKTAFLIESFSDEFSSALIQSAASAFADSISDGDFDAADISNLFGGLI